MFDISNLSAEDLKEEVQFSVKVTTTSGNAKNEIAAEDEYKLMLVSDPETRLKIIASSMKEVFMLSSLFEHFYEVIFTWNYNKQQMASVLIYIGI